MSYSASSEFTDLVSAKLALIEDELGPALTPPS